MKKKEAMKKLVPKGTMKDTDGDYDAKKKKKKK